MSVVTQPSTFCLDAAKTIRSLQPEDGIEVSSQKGKQTVDPGVDELQQARSQTALCRPQGFYPGWY